MLPVWTFLYKYPIYYFTTPLRINKFRPFWHILTFSVNNILHKYYIKSEKSTIPTIFRWWADAPYFVRILLQKRNKWADASAFHVSFVYNNITGQNRKKDTRRLSLVYFTVISQLFYELTHINTCPCKITQFIIYYTYHTNQYTIGYIL